MHAPAVQFHDVRVTMQPEGRETVFDFAAEAGEWLAFVGANRSGKSLILKLCAGLVEPESGTVHVPDRVGIVLQQPGLLSNMTVFNNVALPLRYHGELSEAEIASRVMEELTAFGLESRRDQFPADLNRGEARCVAMARMFAMGCDLALLDDPSEGLDTDTLERLAGLLARYRDTRSMTVLMTAGASSLLLDRADRVVLVREGRLFSAEKVIR